MPAKLPQGKVGETMKVLLFLSSLALILTGCSANDPYPTTSSQKYLYSMDDNTSVLEDLRTGNLVYLNGFNGKESIEVIPVKDLDIPILQKYGYVKVTQ